MKKMILTLIVCCIISLCFSQSNNTQNTHNIYLTSYFTIESDNLNTNFLNTMLFGGFITDEMKNNWINNGDDNNQLNAELTNRVEYRYSTDQLNSYYFQLTDVNLINSSFNTVRNSI